MPPGSCCVCYYHWHECMCRSSRSGLDDRRQMAISPGKSGGKSLHLKPTDCAKAGQSNSTTDLAEVNERKGGWGGGEEIVGTIPNLKSLQSEWSLCWRLLSPFTTSTAHVPFRNTLHTMIKCTVITWATCEQCYFYTVILWLGSSRESVILSLSPTFLGNHASVSKQPVSTKCFTALKALSLRANSNIVLT